MLINFGVWEFEAFKIRLQQTVTSEVSVVNPCIACDHAHRHHVQIYIGTKTMSNTVLLLF